MKTKTNLILILLLVSTYCIAQNSSTSLFEAAREGSVEGVRKLLRAGADVNMADQGGVTPLIWAARRGHLPVVQELLRAGADVKKVTKYGATPLIWAAEKGYLAVVRELIQAGVDINKATSDGYTPLIWAARQGQLQVVQELLKTGADVNKKNNEGKTAFDLAKTSEIGQLILEAQKIRAQMAQMKPVVFQQIDDLGKLQQETLDLVNKYEVAQAQKISAKEIQNIQQQIKIKADSLRTALDKFKQLITQVTMNLTDADGNTPLHKAVQTNNSKLVEWIFQFQPDLAKRKNNAGQTPVELAAGRPAILKLLMRLQQ